MRKLIENDLWWTGPEWLKEQSVISNKDEKIANEKDLDLDIESVNLTCAEDEIKELFQLKNYSDLSRVLRVTAWVKRFCKNVKGEKIRGPLTANELFQAENYWIHNAQNETFSH